MSIYDVRGASRGVPSETPVSAEERLYKQKLKMIKSAEAANYDGDVETYEQVKALALQLGVPIKSMQTSALRKMGVAGYSLLDTALLGLLPNSVLQPVNEAERTASAIGSIGGAVIPYGLPAKLARGIFGGLKSAGALKGGNQFLEGFGKGFGKYGWNPFKGGTSTKKAADTKKAAEQLLLPPGPGSIPKPFKTKPPKALIGGGPGTPTVTGGGGFNVNPTGVPLFGGSSSTPSVILERAINIVKNSTPKQLDKIARDMGLRLRGSMKAEDKRKVIIDSVNRLANQTV